MENVGFIQFIRCLLTVQAQKYRIVLLRKSQESFCAENMKYSREFGYWPKKSFLVKKNVCLLKLEQCQMQMLLSMSKMFSLFLATSSYDYVYRSYLTRNWFVSGLLSDFQEMRNILLFGIAS